MRQCWLRVCVRILFCENFMKVLMILCCLVGYDNAVIDRGTSLCGHSILYYRPYVMLDATKDFRFTNLHVRIDRLFL